MDPVTFIKTLTTAMETVNALKRFVEGEINAVLSAVGDNHFSAAMRALSDREKSRQPDREVTMAITHLRGAYEAHAKGGAKSQVKAYQAACLIAVCYRYLQLCGQELETDIIRSWLSLCEARFGQYEEIRMSDWRAISGEGASHDTQSVGFLVVIFIGLFLPSKLIPQRLEKEKEAHRHF
jgi:hypothetical protein